jgi:hypothetical protein
VSGELIADVVLWGPKGDPRPGRVWSWVDLSDAKLTDAINWVISEQMETWRSSVFNGIYIDPVPKVYIKNVSVARPAIYAGRKLGKVGGGVAVYACVVSDRELTEEECLEVYRQSVSPDLRVRDVDIAVNVLGVPLHDISGPVPSGDADDGIGNDASTGADE